MAVTAAGSPRATGPAAGADRWDQALTTPRAQAACGRPRIARIRRPAPGSAAAPRRGYAPPGPPRPGPHLAARDRDATPRTALSGQEGAADSRGTDAPATVHPALIAQRDRLASSSRVCIRRSGRYCDPLPWLAVPPRSRRSGVPRARGSRDGAALDRACCEQHRINTIRAREDQHRRAVVGGPGRTRVGGGGPRLLREHPG